VCIIIDTNVLHEVFSQPPTADGLPVRAWLEERDGRLVFGGVLARELVKDRGAARFVKELERSGRAKRVNEFRLQAEEQVVRQDPHARSDDPHIVALARVSGARVLFSRDRKLHEDFGNRALVSTPRGRVYTSNRHARLLRHDSSCGRLASK